MPQERENSISQGIVRFLQEEASHGLSHAQETARLTQGIMDEPEYLGKLPDYAGVVLNHAALLHDIGYGSYEPWWSGTQEEHPAASCLRAHAILKDIDFYQQHPDLLGLVLWLIYNHDNTNYMFPAFWRLEERYLARSAPSYAVPRLLPGSYRSLQDGIASLVGRENAPQVERYTDERIDLLQILQEADSRLGDAQRTLAFCKKRGIPPFINEGGVLGIGPLWWQTSAAANIVLALNRALLDAHTESGKIIARRIYKDGTAFVKDLYTATMNDSSMCRPEQGVAVIGELGEGEIDMILSRNRENRWDNQSVKQTSLSLCIGLEATLGEIQSRFGKPYQYIASRIARMGDLEGGLGSTQVGEPAADTIQTLRAEIIRRYAMDIFQQLVGSARVEIFERDWVLGDEIHRYPIVPPVIEVHHMTDIGRPPYRVLSGGNWIQAAIDIGIEETRVLFVS